MTATQTPEQIANAQIATITGFTPTDTNVALQMGVDKLRTMLIAAVEADRAERSKMEKFGTAVYEIMDGEEWSSDTTQAIGDYAALVLEMPFSGADDSDEGDDCRELHSHTVTCRDCEPQA